MSEVIESSATTEPLSRRELQKEAKRSALIDAALSVFSRVGFAAAKMDDVAQEAGVSKGTVYLYFDSKEQLFEAVVHAKMTPMLDSAKDVVFSESMSASERLKLQMRFFYSKVLNSDRRQIMRLIMAEGPNFPQLAEFYHTNILSRGRQMIEAIIQEGIERGEFREMNRYGLAQNIVAGGLLAGMWKLVFEPFEPLDLDTYFDTHLDLVLNGLRAISATD